jgi:hypothetical protein
MIDAGERYYPEDIFPTFWERLDGLANAGRLKAPNQLIEEMKKKSENWRKWVYDRQAALIQEPDQDFIVAVKSVVSQYQKQSPAQFNPDRLTNDPFFIALAKSKGYTLITSELSRPGGFRIPAICKGVGVQSITLLGVVRAEGWKF